MKPTEDLDTLSPKERRLVEIIAGGEWHRTRAMLKAGYARSTALKQQARVIDRPRVQRALLEIEYRRGRHLTDQELRLLGKDPDDEKRVKEELLRAESREEARLIVARQLAGKLR